MKLEPKLCRVGGVEDRMASERRVLKGCGLSIFLACFGTLVASPANAAAAEGTGAPVPGNRIADFCRAAPAPTVVRAKLHGGADLAHVVEVECMWGEQSSTEHLAQRFFGSNAEDETLLVSVGKDGNVLGTAWPVFKEKVSLEFGIPDMSEEEAVALLTSTKCADDLKALRDRGVRPKPMLASHSPPGRGCAHCTAGSTTTSASDLIFALVLGAITLAVVRRRSYQL
jgi:MYXO-CTERM domain-containing protein